MNDCGTVNGYQPAQVCSLSDTPISAKEPFGLRRFRHRRTPGNRFADEEAIEAGPYGRITTRPVSRS